MPPIRFLHPARRLLYTCVCVNIWIGTVISILCQQDRWTTTFIPSEAHLFCFTFAPILLSGWTSEDGAHLSLVDWGRMLSDSAKDFNESSCVYYNTTLSIFTKPGVAAAAHCPPSFCHWRHPLWVHCSRIFRKPHQDLGRIIRWWSSVVADDRHVDCFSIDIGTIPGIGWAPTLGAAHASSNSLYFTAKDPSTGE